MTRLELFAAVQELAHRSDVVDFFDTALQMAESKIAKALRTTELITFAQIDTSVPETNPGAWQLPADYLEMRDVIFPASNHRRTLHAVGRDQIAAFSGSGGSGPSFYSIYNGVIEFRPSASDGLIDIIYFAKNAPLLVDADTNDTITAFPEVYIFGCMIGIWTWAQDEIAKGDAVQEFTNAVLSANEFADNQRFGTGMRQFAGNNYSRRSRQWA